MSRELESLLERTAAETGLPVDPGELVRRGRRRRRVRHAAVTVVTFAVIGLAAVAVPDLLSPGPAEPEIVGPPAPTIQRVDPGEAMDFSAVAGSWEGRAVPVPEADKSGENFLLRATFDAVPDRRGAVGTARWFYADGTATCDVDLHANRADPPRYVVGEFVTATLTEDRCYNGFVELTLRADGTLVYAYGVRTSAPIVFHLTRVDGT